MSCPGLTLPKSIPFLLSAKSTSAGPSALTSIHERSRVTKVLWRKESSMWVGTNQSRKYSFPLHVLCLSGDSDEHIFILPSLFLMKTVASLWRGAVAATCRLLYSMRLVNSPSLAKRKFVQTLVYPVVPDGGTSCRKKVKAVLSTSHSCQKSSATEPRH